jgi:multidrug efflux pump subunit AcrB
LDDEAVNGTDAGWMVRSGQRVSLSTLRTLQVPLPSGRTVPLGQIASFEFDQEYPLIWRRAIAYRR